MKKILFPTDFSFASLNAFRYALHLAHKIGAEIITLHVYEKPAGTYMDYYDFLTKNYNVADLAEFENLKSDVPKLRDIAEQEKLGMLKISHMLHMGDVVDTIIKVAAKERAEFIVMGTTGATGLEEVFLGSVTEDVLSKASSIVLAIPQWCFYQPIKNFLFLTKYKESQMVLLEKLRDLGKLFQARIDVLHVTDRHDDNETAVVDKWKNAFSNQNIHFYVIRSTDPEGTIIDFIETNKIDIVAMPIHHKNFIKKLLVASLSQKLTFHSKVPIMGMYIG